MGKITQTLANFNNKGSISYRMRSKRMQLLEEYVIACFGKIKNIEIVDLGGTWSFWKVFKTPITRRATITLINLSKQEPTEPRFRSFIGDVRCLPQIVDEQFDLVFSNSVIEHLENFEDQTKMADEIRRIGKKHFIQTPNKGFFFEPHFLFPYFQFLPTNVQVYLIRRWSIGQFPRAKNHEDAMKIIKSVNLLTINEFKYLFSQSCFYYEKFLGFNKSMIAYSNPN